MDNLRVLVGCEFSGVVREAFNAIHGVHAISCDIIPAQDGRTDYHYQGDVRDIINDWWDLGIFFPPCTYSCNSGVRWMYNTDGTRNLERWEHMVNGATFFKACLDANIPHVACENPIPHKYALEIIGRKYDQIIQPSMFGHTESKATCLWLKNLPPLVATNDVSEIMKTMPKKETQKTHYMSPSPTRGMMRSVTYSGVAQGMTQWAYYLLKNLENGY